MTQQEDTGPTGSDEVDGYRYNLDTLQEYLATARQIAGDGRLDEAIDLLREAVRRHPDSPTAHFDLGSAHFEKLRRDLSHLELWESLADDEEAAEECFDQLQTAVSLDPGMVPAYNRLGTLLALRGRHQKAIEVWEQSLAIMPDQPEISADLESCREKLVQPD